MGADCVGGIPHFEQCREFGEHSMHTVVELASKYDKLIDVHCDETDDPNSRYVELLSALAYKAGIGPKVTASHTCSLGSADNAYFFHLTKLLKAAHINFACAPTENLYLQGRQDTFPSAVASRESRSSLRRVSMCHWARIQCRTRGTRWAMAI